MRKEKREQCRPDIWYLRFCCWQASLPGRKRELFEIPEVRAYLKRLDHEWPYWFFFLSQADDSIQMLESCLCDTIEVIPGVASIDLDQMDHALTRHFGAMNRLCQELNLPEEICGQIAEGVISLIHNAAVEGIEGEDYR